MKELKSIIKIEKIKIYSVMGVSLFIALTFTVFSIFVSLILLFLVVGYAAILYPVFKTHLATLKLYDMILIYTESDPKKALELLNSEIDDLNSVLNVQKTEMDIHSLNATNEGKAMRASRANEAGLRRKLGLFKRLSVLINVVIKSAPLAQKDIWDE